MQHFIMLVGLPGSGKSTYAKDFIKKHPNTVHLSSDAIRAELYGDESVQTDHNKVFRIMHQRVFDNLREGKDVIYDATNVVRKKRVALLNQLPKGIWSEIHVVWQPLDVCIERDRNRARTVGKDVIEKFLYRWQSPFYDEPVDNVKIIMPDKFDYYSYMMSCLDAMDIPHDNPHHEYGVYEHCVAAMQYGLDHGYDKDLCKALEWHDIGKPLTKTWKTDELGVRVGPAHYYEHDNVGGYLSYGVFNNNELDVVKFSWLINNHMQPFFNSSYWKNLDPMFKEWIDLIHTADRAGH